MSFEEVIKTIDWPYGGKDFILVFYQLRLKAFIEKILDLYAKKLNAENFLNFELESIAKSAIWLAKKKYIQELVWTDPDLHFNDLQNVKSKGFEIVQSSTPTFARQKLKMLNILSPQIMLTIIATFKDSSNTGIIKVRAKKNLNKKVKPVAAQTSLAIAPSSVSLDTCTPRASEKASATAMVKMPPITANLEPVEAFRLIIKPRVVITADVRPKPSPAKRALFINFNLYTYCIIKLYLCL
jgi:hypothetical protein